MVVRYCLSRWGKHHSKFQTLNWQVFHDTNVHVNMVHTEVQDESVKILGCIFQEILSKTSPTITGLIQQL